MGRWSSLYTMGLEMHPVEDLEPKWNIMQVSIDDLVCGDTLRKKPLKPQRAVEFGISRRSGSKLQIFERCRALTVNRKLNSQELICKREICFNNFLQSCLLLEESRDGFQSDIVIGILCWDAYRWAFTGHHIERRVQHAKTSWPLMTFQVCCRKISCHIILN